MQRVMSSPDPVTTHIGVLVVHGIGEQRRFEHVDGQVRQLVSALQARSGVQVTTEIRGTRSGAYQAASDTWDADGPVGVHVYEADSGRRTLIEFHEVWWADVNEPYSLMKQLRFWGWALSVWLYPDKKGSALSQAAHVTAPLEPGWGGQLKQAWVRTRLFGVAIVAVVAAASVGLLCFLAERLLKLQPPDILRIFVNYVAGVKLYNQKHRIGPGLPSKPQDFLDTGEEPPRVSVRRRMVRGLMKMAEGNYERWYVLAHSLGSVIAFNGLMETAYSWPGYFTRTQWDNAKDSQGPLWGDPKGDWTVLGQDTVPSRPVWLVGDALAYRSRIFHRLHGFLTFGCPLEKFAAVWPARVPLTKERAFRCGTQWINVYDPTDPVSGVLTSFTANDPNRCPTPENFGFAAGPVLLLSHTQYLRASKAHKGLADAVAEWLLTGNSGRMGQGPEWFAPSSSRHKRRKTLAWISWFLALGVLSAIGGVTYPLVFSAVRTTVCASTKHLESAGVPGMRFIQCRR
jgi:hypothetical protein